MFYFSLSSFFFFFNDTATTEIYTLSLHDALPICSLRAGRIFISALKSARFCRQSQVKSIACAKSPTRRAGKTFSRSEEHTSELQSLAYLVCRLLLEKKKTVRKIPTRERRCVSSICVLLCIYVLLLSVFFFFFF